jgi:hypothetical protein
MLRTYPTQCLEKSGNQIKLVDRDPLAIGAVSPTEEYAAVITGTEKWSKIYQMSIMQRQTKKIKHQFPALTFDEFAKTFSTLGFLGHLHKMFYIHNPTNMIKEVSLEAANSQAQDFGVSAVPADLTEKGMEVDDEFFSNLQILVRDVAPQDHQHNVVARVLEVGTGNTLADLHGSRQKITGLELSSDSRYVYSADEGGFLRAFEWGRVRAR